MLAVQLILFIAITAVLYYFTIKKPAHDGAQRILDSVRKNFTEYRDLRTLSAEELPPPMAAKLDEAKRLLEPLGFSPFCDVEDRTFTKANGILIPIRYFTEEKKATLAAAYFHPALKYLVLDFMSDLSDGRHLMTSNAVQAGKILVPPNDLRKFLDPMTAAGDMLEKHRAWLAEVKAAAPGVRTVTPATPGAVLDRYQQGNREKWAFHRDRGWISFEELKKMAPGQSEAVARRVYAEIQKILQKERDEAR